VEAVLDDERIGVVSVVVRYGVYALHSENALPTRYQSETVQAETDLPLQQYLQYWDLLAASTQSALTDDLSVPLSGDLLHPTQAVRDGATHDTAPVGHRDSLLADTCGHVAPINVWNFAPLAG